MSDTDVRRRSSAPLWLIEGLDVVELRRLPLVGVALVVAAAGVAMAVVAPGLVPPTPIVGAGVGLAALLLGYAAALAVDAADLVVRGPRHVRSAGGELVAVVPREAALEDARPLARAVLDAREGGERILLGLAAAGRDHQRTVAWTEALGEALAHEGVSVLRVDIAAGRTTSPGLVEVVREGRKIASVVRFEEELLLARMGAGHDVAGALSVLPSLHTRLPRDLDVLLVSLPTAASREVVAATQGLDHVLVVAERDETARVDLIAALDALEGAGTSAQAVLIDDRTVDRLSREPGPAAAEERATDPGPPVGDQGSEPTADANAATADADEPTVDAGAVTARGSDPEPEVGGTAGQPEPAETSGPEARPAGDAAPETAAAPDTSSAPATSAAPHAPVGHADTAAAPWTAATRPQEPWGTVRRVAPGTPAPQPEGDEPEGDEAEREPAQDVRLPEHEVRPAPSPTADAATEPPVEGRDEDVLRHAGAARAASRIDARQQPVPFVPGPARPAGDPDDEERHGGAGPSSGAQPPTTPLESAAPGPERARPADAVVDLESPRAREEAPTDEIPGATPQEQDEASPAGEREDDPLRTTAQLATLLEQLEGRDEEPGQ